MYIAICVRHYWHHRDHFDDAYIVGTYKTQKEAFYHAVCWEIAENQNDEKDLGKYGNLPLRLSKLDFDSEEEIEKFVDLWEDTRYNYLYDDSLGSSSGHFVRISQVEENEEIEKNTLSKAWYNFLNGKKEEAIAFFNKYYSENTEVSESTFEFLKEIGLSEDILELLEY